MVGYKLNPVGARVNHWFQGRVVIWFQGINLLSHEGNSRAGHRMELVNEGNNLVHEVLVELDNGLLACLLSFHSSLVYKSFSFRNPSVS